MRLVLLLLTLQLAAASDYIRQVEQWRAKREQALKAPDGWLTLVGLFWLQEGRNDVGSAEGARVQLPPGFPERMGVIVKHGNRLEWRPLRGSPQQLKSDKSGEPDIFRVGRIRMNIVERGTKFGVRVKDDESPARRSFTHLNWFPIREDWRVTARFVAAPRTVVFDAQAGDPQEMKSPGYVEWEREGRTFRLTPVLEDVRLFFVFRDRTAGRTTYAAARFLYADPPRNGAVELDFNKAYNPPCVFTPYATCPLPPPENRLPVAIEAGEKMYGTR
jgi:uncharacterized protein (DUF1684 family)